MGLFSSLFQKEAEQETKREPEEVKKEPVSAIQGQITHGMRIDVMTSENGGTYLLTGRITEMHPGTLTLNRLPGELSFKIAPLNAEVTLTGYDKNLIPVTMRAFVEESSRTVFKVKDMRIMTHDEVRDSFRLPLVAPVSLYREDDQHYRNPEDAQLVNISTGGCCVESEFVHIEDEVLRVRIKLEDYSPLNYIGQIVRCSEHAPGKFWYGILFAQLTEQETNALNRTLYNLQMGVRKTLMRSEEGHWEGNLAKLEAERKR